MFSLFQLFPTHDKDGILSLSQPKEAAGVGQRGHPQPFRAHGVKLAEREDEQRTAYKLARIILACHHLQNVNVYFSVQLLSCWGGMYKCQDLKKSLIIGLVNNWINM